MNADATLAGVAYADNKHPNRKQANLAGSRSPTHAEVIAARKASGLSQTEAAKRVHATLKSWQNWETDKSESNEARPMHPGLFELFLIKTGQPKPHWL